MMVKNPHVQNFNKADLISVTEKPDPNTFECDICGELFSKNSDVRLIEDHCICVECLRNMKLYELCELCGVGAHTDVYEFLGLEDPGYRYYNEEVY